MEDILESLVHSLGRGPENKATSGASENRDRGRGSGGWNFSGQKEDRWRRLEIRISRGMMLTGGSVDCGGISKLKMYWRSKRLSNDGYAGKSFDLVPMVNLAQKIQDCRYPEVSTVDDVEPF